MSPPIAGWRLGSPLFDAAAASRLSGHLWPTLLLHSLVADPDEAHALRMFRALRRWVRATPERAARYAIRAARRGRPRGRRGLAPQEAAAVALAIDYLGLTPVQILRAMNQEAESGSPMFRKLKRRLVYGREILKSWPPPRELLANLQAFDRSTQLTFLSTILPRLL